MTPQTSKRVGTIVRAGCLASAVVLLIAAAAEAAPATWTLSKPQIPQIHSTAVGSFGPSQPGFGAFVPLAEQRS